MKLSKVVEQHLEDTVSWDFGMETFKKWTVKYVNSLPNNSFAVIEPAYLEGKTKNKNCRHLPFRDHEGKIDMPHLRNALARVNQIKPVTNSITATELRNQAIAVLEKAKEEMGMS